MMTWPEKLAPHFAYKDLVYSKTAEKHGIDNTPPDALYGNAMRLAALAEEARAILGKVAGREIRMHESSGFRCLLLNSKVGGSGAKAGETISAHCFFRALDFSVSGMGLLDAFNALRESDLAFDKLIFEMDHEGRTWIHLQCAREGARPARRVLRGIKTPNGSTYVELTHEL